MRENPYADSMHDYPAKTDAGCAIEMGWSTQREETMDYGTLKPMREVMRARWAESNTCRDLVDVFGRASIPKTANKIVCFGLGTLE